MNWDIALPSKYNMILGIDLGTTHSLVSHFKDSQSQLVKNSHGNVLTPSVISVDEDDTILVGESAKHRLITHPDVTVSEFKRFMGTDKIFTLGKLTFDATELSAIVLKNLKSDAEQQHQLTADEAFISVPAYFNNKQREATKQAAKLAGFTTVRLLNEPTAAALAFGVDGHQDKEAHYIVLDLGGGTFDVSLLEIFNGIFEIHASAGDNYLGGKDFTEAIVGHMADRHRLNLDTLGRQDQNKLYKAAESIKHKLSKAESACVSLKLTDTTFEYSLDLVAFEEVSEKLLQRIKQPITRVLSDADLPASSITGVILVGGATRMQPFRTLVSRLFKHIPRSDYHPDEAIAKGCAIQAGLAGKDDAVSEIIMTDVCPYTLGVAVVGRGPGKEQEFLPLIERNTTIPVSETRPLRPARPDQGGVTIQVYQGESFVPQHNLFLGSLDVDLPEDPAKQQFLLTYTYDLDGTLEVEVTIPETNKRHKAYIKDGETFKDRTTGKRFDRLQHLKVLPYDQQQNREMTARLERLFEEYSGEKREYIAHLLRHFNEVLSTYNSKKIGQAHEQIKEELNQFKTREFEL